MFLIQILALVIFVVFLNACSYGHKSYNQAGGRFNEPNDFVIQVDDFGKFWDPTIATKAVDKINEVSEKKNTIVILYIHGWHHNAEINDKNVIDFADSMRRSRLNIEDNHDGKSGIYRKSREILTGDPEAEVIGIYIGWRGKSLPMPFNYLTFWGRKAAAQRVGRGDVNELLIRLNSIYKQRNTKPQEKSKGPFMGLVSVGHSFGGQVLYSAVSNAIEDELIKITNFGSSDKKQLLETSLQGFGDMVVLINPALEAFQYDRINKLNKQLNYTREQTPLLLVLSAETDFARKIYFPIGRWVDTFFKPSLRSDQKELWTKALGEHREQLTHTVEVLDQPLDIEKRFDSTIYSEDPCYVINYDLTNIPSIAGIQLKSISDHHKYNPFIIANADSRVIIKHSGIFEERLRKFLGDYIAISQAKRILLRNKQAQSCETNEITKLE